MSAPRTARGDTVYGVILAVISVGLVLFGIVVLLVERHQMETVRGRLDRTVVAVAERDHLSPRDPLVLRDVRRAMPAGVRLEPSPDFARTGRLLLVWGGRAYGPRTQCVVVPTVASARVTGCRHVGARRAGVSGSVSP